MRHIYKRCFPNLKNYEIKLKKERTSEQCPEFVKKNPKRPILRGKIVLMTLFSKGSTSSKDVIKINKIGYPETYYMLRFVFV
jgi:hypothetical protein